MSDMKQPPTIENYPGYSGQEWRGRFASETIEWVDPEQLLAHPDNQRIHILLQQQQVERLLDVLGWVDVVKVSKSSGRVIDGHLRVMLAIRHKTKVPVLYLDLTEAEERAALASLDYTASKAGIDLNILATNVEFMQIEFPALEVVWENLKVDFELGGNGHEPKDAPPQIDRAAELQEKWKTELGQLWRIGEHTLYCGSANNANIECDLAIYDPPFEWTAMQYENALSWTRWKTAFVMGRDNCMPLAARHDLWHWWIWDAGMNRFGGRGHNPVSGCALMLLFGEHSWHEKTAMRVLDEHNINHFEWPTQVVHIQDHLAGREHKHEKPRALVEYILSLYSNENQVIGDPFAGSGSFVVAAHRLKRQYYGSEIDPALCAVILERFQSAFDITPELISDAV
jgi:hypothetical protein